MSKLDERIAAAEERLKALKARHVRAATKQRARDAKQKRREDLRRKILVGAVVLELVERGEIETSLLAKWLGGTLANDEDRALFSHYWKSANEASSEAGSSADGVSGPAASKVERGRGARENRATG
jgi:hypothetical protein